VDGSRSVGGHSFPGFGDLLCSREGHPRRAHSDRDRRGSRHAPSVKAAERSWNYVTLGYGHGEEWWRQFCAALRMVGYDGVLSIEHEDTLLPPIEGVRKSVELLRDVTFR
jgi:sugar phosphate isomerase/epimerase